MLYTYTNFFTFIFFIILSFAYFQIVSQEKNNQFELSPRIACDKKLQRKSFVTMILAGCFIFASMIILMSLYTGIENSVYWIVYITKLFITSLI